jgi:hypothetical protein
MIPALSQHDEALMTGPRPGDTLDLSSSELGNAESTGHETHRHCAGDHDGPFAVPVPW